MVLAAGTLRIPAALTEADAHLGLANRLAAPFAKRVFCAFPIEGLDGPKYQVVGRPIPDRSRTPDRAAARADIRPPRRGPGGARLRREPGLAAPERGGARGVRRGGAGRAPSGGRARLPGARAAPQAAGLPPAPLHGRVRGRARCVRPRRRARGRVRVGGRGGRTSPRSSSRIRTRPPTIRRRTRATSSAGEGRSSSGSPSSISAGRSATCSATRRGWRRWARPCALWRSRTRPRWWPRS